jgi:hypothetical protein
MKLVWLLLALLVAKPPEVSENVGVPIYNTDDFGTAKTVAQDTHRLVLLLIVHGGDSDVFLRTAHTVAVRDYLNKHFVVCIVSPATDIARWAGTLDEQCPLAVVFQVTPYGTQDHNVFQEFGWPDTAEDLLAVLKSFPVLPPPKPLPAPSWGPRTGPAKRFDPGGAAQDQLDRIERNQRR